MRRVPLPPRHDRFERFRTLEFDFAQIDGATYWDESAAYRFSLAQIDHLEAATAELERLVLDCVDHAIRFDLLAAMGIPEPLHAPIRGSWERGERSLYGRMDLRWDGTGEPRLLEYNADTPTALYESAVVQWEWLQSWQEIPNPWRRGDRPGPGSDQWNRIHEALVEAWPRVVPGRARVHFLCDIASPEDRGTVLYLRDTALQAGIDPPFLLPADIGWDGARFLDLTPQPIDAAFKLYPWEWLAHEPFGRHLAHAPTRWIEPPWRLVASSKAMLALLWRRFEGHKNLLPAFLEYGRTGGPEISKPFFGREGANVHWPGGTTPGPFADQPLVHQAYAELPCFDGNYPVLGAWIVAGRPEGLGIREDRTPITRDTSRFIPHFLEP